MSHHRQLISDEDAALFRRWVRDAKPLDQRPTAGSFAGQHRKAFLPVPLYQAPRFVDNRPAAAPIGGHTEARLRRGRVDPEARIDLHGHNYDSAYRLLVSFLARAYADGKKLVLIITGKSGVLRQHLPLWLNGPELQSVVIGFREAHVRHGGGGAFYVALYKRQGSGIR
jgi:DNA-nicking Smr family endonuclease